ncbi:hypothetical protein PHYSODRAFT_328942 [Phytophthora sojae]|uniref:Uncharacterized protein n=1 Tax=Phytophthora sojae (strain P6497) TaxID=1094619 RepID=G4Z4P1_PHYSP|nr:hypothetical protein PHYSODRAFT_328942 [Phytophthora sojae]EGZ20885.1 hypothetical protein PHYSODRAFT_328942 [Phytophthora sojae]|eukprot:XP_009523602.1 hypothetical protein PHYSODRAFT_328942 [Phytophthora sojae]
MVDRTGSDHMAQNSSAIPEQGGGGPVKTTYGTSGSGAKSEKLEDELRTASFRDKIKATLTATHFSLRSSPLELHRRCRDTIEKCSARLRDRQRKMDRLQLPLPLPDSDRSAATPTATPPRPVKRNKRNAGSASKRGVSSPGVKSPAWISPATSTLRSKQVVDSTPSTRLRHDAAAASPLMHKNSKALFRDSFTATISSQKGESTATPVSESSQVSWTDKSTDPSPDRTTLLSPTWSQRQQDFMAAIEDEACSDASPSTDL